MIEIDVEGRELYDDDNNLFIQIKGGHFRLEHSLLAISKWEAKYQKPFCSSDKTPEEILDYMSMMNVDDDTFLDIRGLKNEQIIKIRDYIENPMTAQKFRDDGKTQSGMPSKELVTSELVYYWMTALQIPFEAERWNFNRLIALVRLASIKNAPEKKETAAEARKRTAETNRAMRAKYAKKK